MKAVRVHVCGGPDALRYEFTIDDPTTWTDAGGIYYAGITTKPLTPEMLGQNVHLAACYLLGKSGQGQIRLRVNRDFGEEFLTSDIITFAPVATMYGTASYVLKKVEDSMLSGCGIVSLALLENEPATGTWVIDAIVAPLDAQEMR